MWLLLAVRKGKLGLPPLLSHKVIHLVPPPLPTSMMKCFAYLLGKRKGQRGEAEGKRSRRHNTREKSIAPWPPLLLLQLHKI